MYFRIRGIARTVRLDLVSKLPVELKPSVKQRIRRGSFTVVSESDVPQLQLVANNCRTTFLRVVVEGDIFCHLISRSKIHDLRTLAVRAEKQLADTLEKEVRPKSPSIMENARRQLVQVLTELSEKIAWPNDADRSDWCESVIREVWQKVQGWEDYRDGVTVRWNVTIPHQDMLLFPDQRRLIEHGQWCKRCPVHT